jgi:two-component system, NarL family, nitrate/nitrite response regulator NarL
VRVLVISDDALARAGLAALIAGRDVSVVGQGAPGDAAALAVSSQPDVVAWDLGPGAETPADIGLADVPALAILWDEAQGPAAVASGARGIVLRDTAADRLVAALEAVARGLVVLDPALADLLPRRRSAPSDLVEPLTPRENEVLQLLAEGRSNKSIASRLGISEHTAKFHVNAILGKLGAATRTEALAQAARLGLVLL